MNENIDEIISYFPENSLLIELGSGSSKKTRQLLGNLKHLAGYIPVDISTEHLHKSVEELQHEFPKLDIYPVAADYTKPFNLPEIEKEVSRKIVYFPGSTIGNFSPSYAAEFTGKIADIAGHNGGLLIGVDLKKERDILEAAYNDSKNVTAEFNLNILKRLNREYSADFDLDNFYHQALYNDYKGRVEMHLFSKCKQSAALDGRSFDFEEGESIITEYSYKYSVEEFRDLISDSFVLTGVWTDVNNYFSVQFYDVRK
jgi:dimethylhistidine N-methyltransferase